MQYVLRTHWKVLMILHGLSCWNQIKSLCILLVLHFVTRINFPIYIYYTKRVSVRGQCNIIWRFIHITTTYRSEINIFIEVILSFVFFLDIILMHPFPFLSIFSTGVCPLSATINMYIFVLAVLTCVQEFSILLTW